ncbi:MAG: hypothetical protein KAI47_10045 [Deltaproteobacteria bacterium]|nr:hypothetical protein [Deltaproteobacteria bacterium]
MTRSVKLTVKARTSDAQMTGSGSLRIKQRAFGYNPYSARLGIVKMRAA